MEIEELKKYYSLYNERYFEGKVNYQLIVIKPLESKYGDCNDTKRLIRVCEDEDSLMLGTLLHEMIHAYIGCSHGHDKVFKDWAVRLESETGLPIRSKLLDVKWYIRIRWELDSLVSEWDRLSPSKRTLALEDLKTWRRKYYITNADYKHYKELMCI